jgi:hypothetical protein
MIALMHANEEFQEAVVMPEEPQRLNASELRAALQRVRENVKRETADGERPVAQVSVKA